MKVTPSNPLILIVDDDRSTRTLLKVAMEEEGYRVIEAKDGEQCLVEYHRHQPDMVLLDAVMPEMDGFTCCQELQKHDRGYGTPILMITALDDQDSIDQAFACGAIDYVTKPIHWAVLAQRVKRLLSTNKVLGQLEILRQSLEQQQQWLQLFAKITDPNPPSHLSLKAILTQARKIAQADRVILYASDETIRLESASEAVPSTQELPLQLLGLDLYYRNQDPSQEVIAIGDLCTNHLPEKAIAPLVQLQTRAVLMLPLLVRNSPWGWLCLHQCHPRLWQDWEVEQYKLFRNLAIQIITYS